MEWLASLSEIHESRDYIIHSEFRRSANYSGAFSYWKRDFLFKSGTWGSEEVEPYFMSIRNSANLVIGESDYSFGEREFRLLKLLAKVRRVWAANFRGKFLSKSPIQPVPIGLTSPTGPSPLHALLGDASQLAAVWSSVQQGEIETNPKLYFNFSPSTSSRKRRAVIDVVKGLDPSTFVAKEPKFTSDGRIEYLRDIAAYRFNVCPEGNGMDTHRFWETLYLGGIPVVLRGSYQHRLGKYLSLPVMAIRAWRDLSDFESIKEEGAVLSSRLFDFTPLRLSFWANQFQGGSEQVFNTAPVATED